MVVASLKAEDDRDQLSIGIAADEVIGTFSTAESLLIEEAPKDLPHSCGILRH